MSHRSARASGLRALTPVALMLWLMSACTLENVLDATPSDLPPTDGGTPPDSPPDDPGNPPDDPGNPPDDPGSPPDNPNNPPDNPPPDGAVLGNSLPADWRPFAADSPWNTTISANARTRAGSDVVIGYMASQASRLRFANSYTIPVWVVNSENLDPVIIRSDRIYNTWDQDDNGYSDVGVPLVRSMWGENTGDGHICIIDPYKGIAWEMSRYGWSSGSSPQCTTFNIWDLNGRGYADPNAGGRWQTIGGRGSGFPLIAGLVRPEEVEAGEIRHALVFTFGSNRKGSGQMFVSPPGARSDGKFSGAQYPIEGSLFQLDPSLTDRDFDAWGLSESGRVVARALQRYGMYLCDNGGDWALQAQLLSANASEHRDLWEQRLPGFYRSIEDIPTNAFRVIEHGQVYDK